ncbi:hypothetical protein KR032_001403 [Drosophila birchii]|nr:hypothetical protein KR032_001403 [Drosophila birchii]
MAFMAVSVNAESLIEVDENGDEYELKRFYIQGRQLKGDGSQSQCVVTRRKRSGRALSAGTKTGETGASVQVSSQTLNVESLPAMMEHREGAATLQEVDPTKRRYVALTGVHYEPHVPNDDDDDEDVDDDDEVLEEEAAQAGQSAKSQSQFVPAALALPLAQGSQGGAGEQASAAHLPQGVSVVANAASHANVAEDAGIVVVQSHQPPKVNPDTHAVFELKPIQADFQQPAVSFYPFVHPWETVVPEDEDDYDEDDYDEEDYDDFYYGPGGYYRDQPGYVGLGEYDEHIVSEEKPSTTTAIWSTNDDSDIHPVINQANKRPNQNQNKNKNKNKNKNTNMKNKKRKNQKQQTNKKRVSQKKRKEEAEENHELMTQTKKKIKEQKEKDQKKKQQDMDQVQEMQQDQMDQSPVDVIKKPAAVAASSAQASLSSSSSSSSGSSSMSSLSNSSGSNSSVQKKKKKKEPSSSSSSSSTSQRRTKKKKKQTGSSSSSSSMSYSGNRRRRPSSSSYSGSSSSSSSSIGGYRRRRPQLTQQQKRRQEQQRRRRRQQNNRRRQQQQMKRRRNRNKNRQFYGDEPIVNCIYINKDPPTTTTPRPFWNILGRQSDGQNAKDNQAPGQDAAAAVEPVDPVAKQAVLQAVRRNFGDFGGRKRTNLRFVA